MFTDFLKCEFLKPCIYLLFRLLHLSCHTVYVMTEENHCFTLEAHYLIVLSSIVIQL